MSSIKLISHPLCPYVHRAAALLTELNVAFELELIDLENKPAWFLELSPRGKVPVLVVDGTAIFESNVILEYLAERFAPQLIFDDALARARRRMWMEIANDLFSSNYKVATAASKADRDAGFAAARETLGRFESQLSPGPFVGGDKPGLVDFAAGPALVRFDKLRAQLGVDVFKDVPRAAAWAKAINERAAFKNTLVPDFDERYRAFVRDDIAA